MSLTFFTLTLVTLAGAIAALSLRNLVHCALSLVVGFIGLAGLYFHLGAPFVGLAQVLVYVGAVAILIVFAILLTRDGAADRPPLGLASWAIGLAVAGVTAGVLTTAALRSPVLAERSPHTLEPSARELGFRLMTDYVVPLEAIGLLLTAALIGAVLLAMRDTPE